ncbi:hypothetical protein KBC31_00175 [Candidatus Saccharibacteria bacterium]|jgi:hypothetical protein|nr:hypothetical protein [Candidatus Saccharibacteria bacterium]
MAAEKSANESAQGPPPEVPVVIRREFAVAREVFPIGVVAEGITAYVGRCALGGGDSLRQTTPEEALGVTCDTCIGCVGIVMQNSHGNPVMAEFTSRTHDAESTAERIREMVPDAFETPDSPPSLILK